MTADLSTILIQPHDKPQIRTTNSALAEFLNLGNQIILNVDCLRPLDFRLNWCNKSYRLNLFLDVHNTHCQTKEEWVSSNPGFPKIIWLQNLTHSFFFWWNSPWELLIYYKILDTPCVLRVTLWTIARQAPLSMGFTRQEDWSGLSFSWYSQFLALV